MKKLLHSFKSLLFITTLLLTLGTSAQTITITTNRLWSSIGSTAANDVLVKNGATLTVDVTDAACRSIQLGDGNDNTAGSGTLKFNPYSILTVSTDVTLGDNSGNSIPGSLDMTNGGILLIGGSFTAPNLGTFTPGSGKIKYTGSILQNILSTHDLGGVGHEYFDLGLTNSGVKKMDGTPTGGVTVTNILNIGSSTTVLDLGTNNITLKSTLDRTAQLAPVIGTILYSGTGKFIIERFVRAHRAWRFLSVPISPLGAPTIKNSWMEGGQVTTMGGYSNPNPGYGTHITGPNAVPNGLDVNPSGNPSAKYYSAGNYPGVTTSNQLITSQPAYMLFVRGSRANVLTSGVNAVADNTTLRISGQVKTGDQVYPNVGAGIQAVGNPYPSAINLVTAPNSITGFPVTYSVWDPLLTGTYGVGAFIQYIWNPVSNHYDSSVVGHPSPLAAGIIQSGSAFLVQYPTTSSFTIKETDKIPGSAQVQSPTTAPGEQVRVNLYAVNTDGTTPLMDGTLVNYDNFFSNAVDNNDATKNMNFAENLSISRNGQMLAVERRSTIVSSDTIFLTMQQMSQKPYQFQIMADNLDHPGMSGYLNDNFLGTQTPINLNGTTTVSFTVTSDPASSASGRFTITFNTTGPLPVQYTNVRAYRRISDIVVEWTVENELNMQQYIVEHSMDGRNFNTIANTIPTGNNNSRVNYLASDLNAFNGDNFYRVKGISVNGRVQYSPIVKVGSIKGGTGITVYPNPITGNVINLQFTNQVAGTYKVRLFNGYGQMVYSNTVKLIAGNSVESLPVGQQLPKGVYQIEVMNGADVKMTQKLIVE